MNKVNAINFLLFGYFGITLENSKDDIISAAINRAYRDAASHVLSLKDEYKKKTDKGKELYKKSADLIYKFIESINESKDDNYNTNHKNVCYSLISNYNDNDNNRTNPGYKFSYGIAQKWVNMTMKYLGVILTIFTECKEECKHKNDFITFYESFQAVESYLHVPIDGYILEYVSKKKYSKVEQINIDKNNLAWSKYEEENYNTLQNSIKQMFIEEKTSPLDWENEAWIEVAKTKK